MLEHLVKHETPIVQHMTPRNSFTAVAHGFIERTPDNIWYPLCDSSFTFILHFLLPNLTVWLIINDLIYLLSKSGKSLIKKTGLKWTYWKPPLYISHT